jgi:hypothetical protein
MKYRVFRLTRPSFPKNKLLVALAPMLSFSVDFGAPGGCFRAYLSPEGSKCRGWDEAAREQGTRERHILIAC